MYWAWTSTEMNYFELNISLQPGNDFKILCNLIYFNFNLDFRPAADNFILPQRNFLPAFLFRSSIDQQLSGILFVGIILFSFLKDQTRLFVVKARRSSKSRSSSFGVAGIGSVCLLLMSALKSLSCKVC